MTARLAKFAREKAWSKWKEPSTVLTAYLGRWWDSFFVHVRHIVAHGLVVWNTLDYIRESIGNGTIIQRRSVWWSSVNIVSRWLIPSSLWRSSNTVWCVCKHTCHTETNGVYDKDDRYTLRFANKMCSIRRRPVIRDFPSTNRGHERCARFPGWEVSVRKGSDPKKRKDEG